MHRKRSDYFSTKKGNKNPFEISISKGTESLKGFKFQTHKWIKPREEKKSDILLACEICFTRYSLDEYSKEHKVFTMTLGKYNFEILMLFVQVSFLPAPPFPSLPLFLFS